MLKESSKKILKFLDRYDQNFILLVGVFGVFVSLYFSTALDLAPCDLCWYQRILFFPIPIIALVGLLLKDDNSRYYVLVLSLVGLPISIYHHLLKVTNLFGKDTIFCGEEGACSKLEWELWTGSGITIPLLVALAFVIIIMLSLIQFIFRARYTSLLKLRTMGNKMHSKR